MRRSRRVTRRKSTNTGFVKHIPLFLIGVLLLGFGVFKLGLFPNGVLVKNITTGEKPNIIVIMTDDQAPGSEAKMPYLMSKPHGDWVEFSNSFVNNPLCCPSRATFFSGLYEHHHMVRSNDQGYNLNDSQTIATWLQGAGYKTALIGKYLNGYPYINNGQTETYVPPGWDDWRVYSGNVGYANFILNENGTNVSYTKTTGTSTYSTDLFTTKALNFINSTNEPFFLMFAPNNPHGPYDMANRHKGRYANEPVTHTPNFNEEDVSDKPLWVRSIAPYTATGTATLEKNERRSWESLLSVDEAIQKFIDAVAAKGELDNTIIVFTSDHGYAWGQHRWNKKQCEYEECIRTPLLMRVPGVGNKTESRLVQNIDLAPTLADLAGVTVPTTVDGVSLVPLLNNTATNWRTNMLFRGHVPGTAWWGVRTENWKYVELEKTREKELYDLTNDPYELNNLANKSEYATTQADLASQLLQLRGIYPPTPTPTTGTGSTWPTATPATTSTKPVITLTAPTSWNTYSGLTPISADASDDSGIKQVNFFVNSVKVGQDITAPYTFYWDTTTYPNAQYTIHAVAVDNQKESKKSSTVTVNVSN